MAVDLKAVEAKLDKNEKLSKEEEQFLMENQSPPEGFKSQGIVPEKEEPAKQTPEAKKAAEDKVAADKKAQDALIGRAKAAGLPETATEAEIQAAEIKKPPEDHRVDMLKLETMLERKDDATDNDIQDWSAREKAYYWRMRREQKRATKAEEDRDMARFELSKLKKPAEKPAEEPKKEEDPFEGKEPGDFLTVADAKKILVKSQEAATKKEEAPKSGLFIEHPLIQSFLKRCDEEVSKAHEDYEVAMELSQEIIGTNPDYQKKVAEALVKGENPALTMYELIKADPEFAKLLPAAQTRVAARKVKKSDKAPDPAAKPKEKTPEELQQEKEAQAAEDKLKENAGKPKTSGHAEGKDGFEGSGLSLEQITAMSDREFAKLGKKVREKYLELYGS
jgi:hypothetical protein